MANSGATAPAQAGTATDTQSNPVKELTIRGIIIGGVITLIFTAANVYLGLKVGLTFATSIPAAVISMAVLRAWKDHTVQENNIVQTIASAAGTLSAIIFVLPGLVIIGWWNGFPYWTTVAVCAVGGILGVMYSIPLRRALVTNSDLPYPEGVAAAEVLKVGDSHQASEENTRGLKIIAAGGISAAVMNLLVAMKVIAGEVSTVFRVGPGATMLGSSLSLALIGIGHLIGITVGIAMIVGLLLSYGFFLPFYTSGKLNEAGANIQDVVGGTFSTDVRFIGAGVMAIAAVWTLIKVMGPIFKGMKESMEASRKRQAGIAVAREEQDIPVNILGGTILALLIPVGALIYMFLRETHLEGHTGKLVTISVVYVLVIGLFVAAVCGYMAGLIGSSNSPISGVGILIVIIGALLILAVHGKSTSEGETNALIAYTLFTAAVVFGVATISNDNLQDLKTGQLVGATPWKQQVALVIGVGFGSLVIPPVLDLMAKAFGFGTDPGQLAAPQASLISALAKGVFGGSLAWDKLCIGIGVGVVIIIIDEVLKLTTRAALPPLAVGMGMYLPSSLTIIIPVGAFIGFFYDKWANKTKNPEMTKRFGVLLATGLIVGESLFGVLNAGIIAAAGTDTALAIKAEGFGVVSDIAGILLFVLVIWGTYRWVKKVSVKPLATDAGASANVQVGQNS
ncbi:OPT family oligopeptide transporter [Actinotignum urinale]|uniref:OPT family oligopeptide transporter n=1 Tax=Actinotignum urinale TaxID=190146 RepID=UPI00280B4F3F|nr:oligopeptide transporter, OPT family [Actinotignum urinale]